MLARAPRVPAPAPRRSRLVHVARILAELPEVLEARRWASLPESERQACGLLAFRRIPRRSAAPLRGRA